MQITMFRKLYVLRVSVNKIFQSVFYFHRGKQVTRFETNLPTYNELSLAFNEVLAVWLVGGELILEQSSANQSSNSAAEVPFRNLFIALHTEFRSRSNKSRSNQARK